MAAEHYDGFEQVRNRLDQIVDQVNAEGVSLDEALALYEEAVKLGLQACDMSEEDAEVVLAANEAAGGVETEQEGEPSDSEGAVR